MSKKTVLWLGFGDLGRRAQPLIQQTGFNIKAISRSGEAGEGFDLIHGELSDIALLEVELQKKPEVLVFTLTPQGRRTDDYQRAYYDVVERVLKLLTLVGYVPELIIFVSSTSVFGQNKAVSEQTEPLPATANAQVLRDTEVLLEQSGLPFCILRFSGIYGPGRYHLLKQVEAGQAGNETMTNRIHADDCAAIIAFVLTGLKQGRDIPRHLLASDDGSVAAKVVRQWLASELGFEAGHLQSVKSEVESAKAQSFAAAENRRIDNSALKALGYQFKYPSYREGFPAIIQSYLKSRSGLE